MNRQRVRLCIVSLSLLFLTVACASPQPIEEFTIAHTALMAARYAEAPRYSAGFWHRAEDHYRRGQKAFKERDYAAAKQHFDQTIIYAERAENATRLQKFQSGEGFL